MSPPLLVLNKPPDIYKYKKTTTKERSRQILHLREMPSEIIVLPLEIIFLEENDRLMLKKVQIHV